MNILKKLGIVVAAHLAVLVLVFLPACQSSSAYASRSNAANTSASSAPTATTNLSRIEAARALDKAGAAKLMHRNTTSRKKSRLSAMVRKLKQSKSV